MPIGARRDKVLHGLARKRPRAHRYTRWRWGIAIAFTVGVAVLPALNLLRFDLWGGNHHVGGEAMDLQSAAKAFAFPFLAINIGIILVTRFFGRYLCGFVCPVGALARIAEWLRFEGRTRKSRWMGHALLGGFCATLTAITFSFWVDWRVFVEGSTLARALSGGFLVVTCGTLWWGAHRIGLNFCRDWCPSGVYFAVLGQETSSGIEFAHPESCTDCKACEAVCPVDLEPRSVTADVGRGGEGFYPHRVSDHALCLRCGDCVIACEGTTSRLEVPTPLAMGRLHGDTGRTQHEDLGDEDASACAQRVDALPSSEERAAS